MFLNSYLQCLIEVVIIYSLLPLLLANLIGVARNFVNEFYINGTSTFGEVKENICEFSAHFALI